MQRCRRARREVLLLYAAVAACCCCCCCCCSLLLSAAALLLLLSDVHGVQGGTGGEKVAGAGDAQVRTVRGLVFCGSRTCGRFTNRDFQGALNLIMVCGVGPRPEHMARTAVGVKRTDYRLLRYSENADFG